MARLRALDRRRAVALLVAAPWVAWALMRGLALDRLWPFVPVVGFTPWAALTAPLPVLVAAALRRFGVAAVALAACVVLVALVAPRGLGGGEERPAGAPTLTVMASNLFVGGADVDAVLRIARREGVDVLVLTEATQEALRRIDRSAGRPAFGRRAADRRANAILTRSALRPRFGAARAGVTAQVTVGGRDVRISAVHPLPPVSRARLDGWRADLGSLPAAPAAGPLRVIAGDFNATLDHHELREVLGRGYRDAAEVTGDGLRPTWPDGRGGSLPITIDHVLADRRLGVARFAAHDIPGSDHDAVVAELVLPAR